MFIYKVRDHSCYKERRWYVESGTENISNIIDAILRKTTQITESYAGDVLYYLPELQEAVKEKRPYRKLYGFREDGVSLYDYPVPAMLDGRKQLVITDCDRGKSVIDHIQVWEVVHQPEGDGTGPMTWFKRVDVSLWERDKGFKLLKEGGAG